MAFKRYRKFRKTYGKRRGGRAKYTTWGSAKYLAKRAMTGVSYLRRLLNVEYKYITSASTSVNPTTSGLFVACSLPTQGQGADQRTGNSILMKNWHIRCHVSASPSATDQTFLRMIMFHDKHSVGTPPTVADVLDSVNINSPYNIANTDRFLILKDKTINLGLASGDHSSKMYTFNRDLNKHWKFSGNTGLDNYPYVMFISNQATYTPTITYMQRLRYIDN